MADVRANITSVDVVAFIKDFGKTVSTAAIPGQGAKLFYTSTAEKQHIPKD
jgi:hypothetical protein